MEGTWNRSSNRSGPCCQPFRICSAWRDFEMAKTIIASDRSARSARNSGGQCVVYLVGEKRSQERYEHQTTCMLSFLHTSNYSKPCGKDSWWLDRTAKWEKPPTGTYKVNTDAAFFNDGSGALAATVRNSRGQAVAGVAEPISQVHDAASAEALAVHRGLQLIHDIRCSQVELESDCLEIIQACTGESDIRAPYSTIMADCFELAHEISLLRF